MTEPSTTTTTDTLADLKAKIETELAGLDLTIRRGLKHMRAVGNYLLACKARCKSEGVSFERWVETELVGKCTTGTAWTWMTLATNWDTFTEDELAQMTLKDVRKAVADRRRKVKPVADNRRNDKLVAVVEPLPQIDPDMIGNGVMAIPLPTQVDHTPVTIQAIAPIPPAKPPEDIVTAGPAPDDHDRIAVVAEKYGLPLTQFRAALAELGHLA